jgi:hypothetical protein
MDVCAPRRRMSVADFPAAHRKYLGGARVGPAHAGLVDRRRQALDDLHRHPSQGQLAGQHQAVGPAPTTITDIPASLSQVTP